MVKLWALMTVYNAEETLFDALTALARFVDKIIIIEGRWIGYEGTGIASTDNTRKEFLRFVSSQPWNTKVEVVYMTMLEQMHQYEARNFLLKRVPEGDWVLWIDSDEIITFYPQDFHKLLESIKDSKGLRVAYAEQPQQIPRIMDMPRLFRKTRGLHYTTNHRYLDDDEGPLNYGPMQICGDFKIVHHGEHKAMRPAAERYKTWLCEWENKNK